MDKYSDKKRHGKIRINKITALCFILIIFILGFIAGRAGQSTAASLDETLNGYNQMEENHSVNGNMADIEDEPALNTAAPMQPPVNTQEPAHNAETQSPKPTDAPRQVSQKTQPPTSLSANITHNEWQLTLVNGTYPLKEGYRPELQAIGNGYFDKRAASHLKDMLNATKAEGLSPVVCSLYRTIEEQTNLYNNKVQKLQAKGLSYKEACEKAKTEVAYPGTSEHNLGLAVDIVAKSYQLLDDAQSETAEVVWLKENCYKYGFILRYPPGKSEITGIISEPWHFRYVGVEAATEIMKKGICLEEYLGKV